MIHISKMSTFLLVSFSGYFLPCMCLQTNLLPKVGSIWFLTQMNLFKKCNSQIWYILSNFAVIFDFQNTGTFTFSFITTEQSMIKTSVSPFWKENEFRYLLKLNNWQFKEKSWFAGAQLMENSDILRKFAHI